MVYRLGADQVVTMDDAGTIYSPGIVDVSGDRVEWVGPAELAPARPDATEVRVDGVLMPGMIDLHCHTPMVLLRGAGEGLPVDRWLAEVMWPREARLGPSDVMAGMRLGAAELLRNGITTSVEMYFMGDAVAQAAERVGLRCVVTAPVIEVPGFERFGSWQSQLEDMVALRERWVGSDLIDIGIGPHSVYATSDECLVAVGEAARDHEMLVHVHVAEQQWEDAAIRERTGHSAVRHLEALGLLDARMIAAHCVWLSDDDVTVLVGRRVAIAHCPCSNAKHASGVAPVLEFLGAGITVGIATDGPASHNRLDLFEEMRTAIRFARVRSVDPTALSAFEALRMVTVDAAAALGRPDLGRLVAGATADIVAISMDDPSFCPVIPADDDLYGRLVWSGSPSVVRSVWVGGRPVVAHGEVLTLDVGDAISEVNERAAMLVG